MIAKGNQRGGGQLAAHLMNALDNEHVELAETRGSLAADIAGAFSEWRADSKTTRCEKYLYSLSVNPDQSQGHLTREQYFEFLEKAERRLGLADQPRVVVFHEKRDRNGELRQHCHAVWSRIDTNAGKAIQISHDRMKLRSVAQDYARKLGRDLPEGMVQDNGPDRHDKQEGHSDLKDKQQEERTGITKEEHRTVITEAWQKTGDGAGFVQALETRGYVLARGDKRAYVVVDQAGEVHSVAKRIEGGRAASVKARLATSHPLDSLPSVEEAKQQMQQQARQRRQGAPPAQSITKEPTDADRRANLKAAQARRRELLADQRKTTETRHTAERSTLEMVQEQCRTIANDAPRPRLQGFAGFVQRFRANLSDRQQMRLLDRRQRAELKDYDRQERSLAVLEAREQRSLDGHLKRDDFRRFATLSHRFEALAERLDARLAQPGVAGDLRASLRDFFARRKPVAVEGIASPARSELGKAHDKATDGPAAADKTDATATTEASRAAAERLREEQDRARHLANKLKF